MMWLYGPRLTLPHVTLVSFILRWARGVVMFGSVLTIGAAIGRLVPFGVDAPRRPRLS
jgi:uncharacterized membrane protein YraQ (UPF0718 family)